MAAANMRDRAHGLAGALVARLGRGLLVPDLVLVEVDLLRARISATAARAFLEAMAAGEHIVVFTTQRLLRRAAGLDAKYADLGLGLVDGVVMAYAERHDLPVLTFDFEHFRATHPASGFWQLIVDVARYRESTTSESRRPDSSRDYE